VMPGSPGHLVACHFAPDQTEASGRAIAMATLPAGSESGKPTGGPGRSKATGHAAVSAS
jgi:hypothetical protein